MRMLVAALVLIAPTALVADIAEVPDIVRLPVHYVDEDRQPITADYLPQQVQFRAPPIPGGINGVPLGINLIEVEASIGDTIELDLGAIEEQVSSIAIRMQRAGAFRNAIVEPENVRVVRLGTFASSTTDVEIYASVGMAVATEESVGLVLMWFDRAVEISGRGDSDDSTFEFDIRIPGEGFWWIQVEEYEQDQYRLTERRVDAPPYISVEVIEVDWVVVEKSGDGFRLMGRAVEDTEHLQAMLDDVGAYAVMLDDGQDWTIGDIARLSPMVDATTRALLLRDANGEIQWINQGQRQ